MKLGLFAVHKILSEISKKYLNLVWEYAESILKNMEKMTKDFAVFY